MSRSDLVVLGVLILVIVVGPAVFWTRLPEPLATHFGLRGQPDGQLSKILWLVVMTAALALTWSVYLASRSDGPLTWRGPVTFGVIGVLVVAQLSIVWANLDAATWNEARSINVPLLLVAMAVAWASLGAIAYVLERP